MTEKTGYKFSAKVNQSLTSGTLGVEAYMAFDDSGEFLSQDSGAKILLSFYESIEKIFKDKGYTVAKDSPNNLKKGPSGK